jgi:hypothetical protein
MKDVGDPFPPHLIPTNDAFDLVYRALNPDFKVLEQRLNPSDKHYDAFQDRDAKDDAHRDALRSYDQAQRHTNEWLRERMCQGNLIAWVWDSKKREEDQIRSHPWASMSNFEMMGVFETGKALVNREKRDIYFNRKEFENVLSEIAQPATGIYPPRATNKGGRPPYDFWPDIKAFVLNEVKARGKPHKDNPKLRSRNQLVELVLNKWTEPGYSTVRDYITGWLAEISDN